MERHSGDALHRCGRDTREGADVCGQLRPSCRARTSSVRGVRLLRCTWPIARAGSSRSPSRNAAPGMVDLLMRTEHNRVLGRNAPKRFETVQSQPVHKHLEIHVARSSSRRGTRRQDAREAGGARLPAHSAGGDRTDASEKQRLLRQGSGPEPGACPRAGADGRGQPARLAPADQPAGGIEQ